jgi:hypothetical protein
MAKTDSRSGLDKLDKPSSLRALRGQIDSLLPRTDLTDAILEINIKST